MANYYKKCSKITFTIFHKTRIIIRLYNILIVDFTSNLINNKSKKDKKKDGNMKTIKTNIKLE